MDPIISNCFIFIYFFVNNNYKIKILLVFNKGELIL